MSSNPHCIRISVVYSATARHVVELEVELPQGAAVQDALAHSAVQAALAEATVHVGQVGVWGRKVDSRQLLNDGDRVELYRPLLVDPKVARRERFASQGARTTGLFAKKRLGAKAGY